MSVINHTPFPALAFRQYNLLGEMNGVVVARGTFDFVEGGPLALAEEQHPLVMADEYAGDPHKTVMTAPSDLVPFRPGTDVTFLGSAFAPGGVAQSSWLCGFRVGEVRKALQVHGPRVWQPVPGNGRPTGWHMSQAAPVTEVPLDWDLAWGGPIPAPQDGEQDVCRSNPLGCGIVDLDHSAPGLAVAAPQIEDPDNPVRDWRQEYVPWGAGPIPPWWRQRQQYAGSYDGQWKETRHPLLPKDFDYRFYQAAPPDQIATPWLKGDEAIELVNLSPAIPRFIGRLPGIALRMRLMREGGYAHADLVLDGVQFTVKRERTCVHLTWRAGFPWPDGNGLPELAVVPPQRNEVRDER